MAMTPEGKVRYWSKGATAQLIMEKEGGILSQAMANGVSVYESNCRRKDGSTIYVSISSTAVRDQNGKIAFVLSSEKDITELKALRDAKHRYLQ